MASANPIDRLFSRPDRLLFAWEGGQAVLLPIDRVAYHRSIFLDDRIAVGPVRAETLAAERLVAAADARPLTSPGWIFHIAQCGSTLLARGLDLLNRTLVLREPLALRQLGVAAATGAPGWQRLLRPTVTLASRRWRPEAPVIVKANVPVNFLLPELGALAPRAPAILLYLPFRAYLLAVLRTDAHRAWVARVTTELAPAIMRAAGPIEGLAIAERAAALWLAQMRAFAALLPVHPLARSLDASLLFAQPGEVLAAAFALFGVAVDEGQAAGIAAGPLFAAHAKNPALAFDAAARLARERASEVALAPEIGAARRWLEARLRERPLPDRLGPALLGAPPSLLDG